ncbi:MAG TPA: hypothetical protein VHG91_21600 [Longimicrobium sp.]|nr:hypothetical protein [Longimicrobium sp.]
MSTHYFRAGAAALLAATAAACSDSVTAPGAGRAPTASRPAMNAAASGIQLISNTVKYRDAGLKPATGRAGLGQLTALALLGADGRAELVATASSTDSARPGTPSISKVQVKAFDTNGAQSFTRTHNGLSGATFTQVYGGVTRGERLEVQANVNGIEPSRTDVVTATETVKLRPDLAVSLSNPGQAYVNTPVNVLAVVRELNGDVGARADCWLYVDGQPTDRVSGAWVDAGDAVTCAFTLSLSATGTRTLEARVSNVQPGDWDTSNNTATSTIEVTNPAGLSYSAYVSSDSIVSVSRFTNQWSDASNGSRGESLEESGSIRVDQRGQMSGYMPVGLPLPFTVEASQGTGGVTLHAESYTSDSVKPWWGPACVADYDYGQQIFFSACSEGPAAGGRTFFSYERLAGSVTYHSTTYSLTYDGATGVENVYHRHISQTGSFGTMTPYGSTYDIVVRFTSGGQTYEAAPSMTLRTINISRSPVESCFGYTYEAFTSRSCSSSGFTLVSKVGNQAAGEPWPWPVY